jgi:Fic family protein
MLGLTDVIFGSNAIKGVGGSIRITIKLCREVFEGRTPNIQGIEERTAEYEEELITLSATGRLSDPTSVIRSRREILQHAMAMKYLLNAIIFKDMDLSEDIIKETHRILVQFSEHDATGGVYREADEVASYALRPETNDE